jgi:hypothetical protein
MIAAPGFNSRSRSRSRATSALGSEVGFADHQSVGDRGLSHRFHMAIELCAAMDRIDGGDDAVQAISVLEQRIAHEASDDGQWVGETGRLDRHTPERRQRARQPLHVQLLESIDELALDGTADASGLEQYGARVQRTDDQMIDRDFTELVDQDSRRLHLLACQQMVEQRGFAAAEEAGDERDRNRATAIRIDAWRWR